MARKPKVVSDENQIPLIDVDGPHAKKFKSLRNAYYKHIAEKNASSKKADENREEILAFVRDAMKVKPDIDGVVTFKLGDSIIKIAPGKAKLTITDENVVEGNDDGAGDDSDADD